MNYETAKAETREHFANPVMGDRFHEMFSFWIIVLYVTDDGGVMTWEYSDHGSRWESGKNKFYQSIDAFGEAFHYKSAAVDGYSVLYCDNVKDMVRKILVESGKKLI